MKEARICWASVLREQETSISGARVSNKDVSGERVGRRFGEGG